MAVLIQVLASIIVCFPCLNLGVLNSLPSSTLDDFTSVNTKLQRPMTEMEVNLYGSLSSAGALVSTPLIALLLDRLGRKYCTILAGLMGVMSWVILAYTNRVEIILAAVFLGGVCGTSFLIVPAFLGEFCQESIRGTMTAGSMVFYGVGTLFSYILGGYLEYMTMVYTAMGMAVVEVILMSWLKESPTLLLKKGHGEKAAASIAFYRQVKINSKVVFQEMASIRRSLNPNESELIPAEEGIDQEHKNTTITEEKAIDTVSKKSMWLYIKTTKPSVQRGVFITLSLMSASVFQGIVVVQVFAEPIFVEAVPSQTATTCTLLLATAIVAASVLGAYLSDLAGRRPLMIYSSIAAGVCCVLLGTQMQLAWGPNWMTPILMYLFSITFSFGGGTVPFVVLAEVFLPEVSSLPFCDVDRDVDLEKDVQVKCFMTMISVVWMWLCYFLCLFVFYPLAAVVGLGGVFHVFGGVCFLSAVFAVFYVPETKGVTLEQVQIMLVEKRNF